MSRQLTTNPNLEHLKKQVKELLHDFELREPAAIERFRALASLSARWLPDLRTHNMSLPATTALPVDRS
jgi:hypothetical protein